MRRNVIGTILITVLVLGALGAIGFGIYQLGFERGLVEEGAEIVVNRVGPGLERSWGGPGWGAGWFGGFGFLFRILFFVLIIGLIARLFWGPRRWGWGPGPYGSRDWLEEGHRSPMEQRLTEWHDKAHDAEGDKPEQGS